MIPETKSNLTKCRVMGANAQRHKQTAKRGDLDYIMSRSELDIFRRNPERWIKGFSPKETAAMRLGSLVDCLELTPEEFGQRYAVAPDTYPDAKTGEPKEWNRNAKYCRQWETEQEGKRVLKVEELSEAKQIVHALDNDPEVARLIGNSSKQVAIEAVYPDEETGLEIPIRGLIDIVPDVTDETFGRSLADLKTVGSVSPREWIRDVFDRGYHLQAALYLDIYASATGEDRNTFYHPIVETEFPFLVGKRFLSSEFIDLGRITYQSALQLYCRCLKENHWPTVEEMESYRGGLVYSGWLCVSPEAWMISNL